MVGIRSFPFGARPIFRSYVSFRECIPGSPADQTKWMVFDKEAKFLRIYLLDDFILIERPYSLHETLLRPVVFFSILNLLPSLKLTASLHLKMDGWKINFLLGFGLFLGAKWLVRVRRFDHEPGQGRWFTEVCLGLLGGWDPTGCK